MRKIITLTSIIVIFIGSLFDNNYLVQPNEIVWSDSLNITWSDFGGLSLPGIQPELAFELTGNQKISFYSQITTDIVPKELEDSYEVKSVFYKGNSFYKCLSKTCSLSENSLRHEIYHFHITELHSRYMRQELTILLQSERVIDLDSIENVYQNHLDSASYKYDMFTRYGSNIINQKKAEDVVDSLLIMSDSLKSVKVKKPVH